MPREVSPAARARRGLLFDGLAALGLTIVVVVISAGVGIVGFAGALVAIVLIVWVAAEKVGFAFCRRRKGQGRSRR